MGQVPPEQARGAPVVWAEALGARGQADGGHVDKGTPGRARGVSPTWWGGRCWLGPQPALVSPGCGALEGGPGHTAPPWLWLLPPRNPARGSDQSPVKGEKQVCAPCDQIPAIPARASHLLVLKTSRPRFHIRVPARPVPEASLRGCERGAAALKAASHARVTGAGAQGLAFWDQNRVPARPRGSGRGLATHLPGTGSHACHQSGV